MTAQTRLPTLVLAGLVAAVPAAPAGAEERGRTRAIPADRPAARAERGLDWTGAYVGVTLGGPVGGGRAREGVAADADRFPPSRTRVRP